MFEAEVWPAFKAAGLSKDTAYICHRLNELGRLIGELREDPPEPWREGP